MSDVGLRIWVCREAGRAAGMHGNRTGRCRPSAADPLKIFALPYEQVGPAVEGIERRGMRCHDPFGMLLIRLVENTTEWP